MTPILDTPGLPSSVRPRLVAVLDALNAGRLPDRVSRANKNRRVGSVALDRRWRVILDCDRRVLLEVCIHSRYNRTLDHWSKLLKGTVR